jgi:hypothetical protein
MMVRIDGNPQPTKPSSLTHCPLQSLDQLFEIPFLADCHEDIALMDDFGGLGIKNHFAVHLLDCDDDGVVAAFEF